MQISTEQILDFLTRENITHRYCGSETLEINNFCALSNLQPACVTWIKNIDAFDLASIDFGLGLLIVAGYTDNKDVSGLNIVFCDSPRAVYFRILTQFFALPAEPGIACDSVLETDQIGEGVSVGHHCFICKDAIIGNNVIIENLVSIQCPARIGDNTIIHSGTVIGADGFGYYQDEAGKHRKIPHFGGVQIGRDVEIGANTSIERGVLADTIIDDNVKISDLCIIGHNVHIESDALLVGMSLICGSSTIEKNAYIGPGSIIKNQLNIGSGAFVGMGSVVMADVPENAAIAGNPARAVKR